MVCKSEKDQRIGAPYVVPNCRYFTGIWICSFSKRLDLLDERPKLGGFWFNTKSHLSVAAHPWETTDHSVGVKDLHASYKRGGINATQFIVVLYGVVKEMFNTNDHS